MYGYFFYQYNFPDLEGKPYKLNGGKLIYSDVLKSDIPCVFSESTVGDLCSISTGTEYANFASEDGKFRFFTCSKNVLWCDKAAFSGNSLIIATHGDFHIEHYSGDFNAYFCNTIIQPQNRLHYGLIYCTISQYLPILQRNSNGSIIKFIGNSELAKIPVLIPDNKNVLNRFNDILFAIEHNNEEIKQLTDIRNWLLPMLMNGQATISD